MTGCAFRPVPRKSITTKAPGKVKLLSPWLRCEKKGPDSHNSLPRNPTPRPKVSFWASPLNVSTLLKSCYLTHWPLGNIPDLNYSSLQIVKYLSMIL